MSRNKSIHNFVRCKCGACSVDGGHYHLSRSFKTSPEEEYIELSNLEDNN